jgi:hypothetical protein
MAQQVETLKTKITTALDALPAETLELLLEFVRLLQDKTEQKTTPQQPHIITLGGLWAGSPEITADDIAEIRREMWADFGEKVQ